MHGPIPRPARTRVAWIKTAAKAALAGVVAAAALIGAYYALDGTDEGRLLLIKWGFEYPGDCG